MLEAFLIAVLAGFISGVTAQVAIDKMHENKHVESKEHSK